MSEIKTRINFDEVSKLMGIATAIVNEWPGNTNILSVVQGRIKEIEEQAAAEVREQKIETAVPGGMPADMALQRGPVEKSFPTEDTDGDGDIDQDDILPPPQPAPSAADASKGRRL